jgi:PHP domain-containing protein
MAGGMPKLAGENAFLSNSAIAELLAVAAEDAKMPLQKALRRASRKALMWNEEAALMVQGGRSLTELPAVGPTLSRIIRSWIEDPTKPSKPAEIRANFLTSTEARAILTKRPDWVKDLNSDLQMHTVWSDGSGSIEDMARAALERKYQFIAITDHSKGLKIAGGIDEKHLQAQGDEIRAVNARVQKGGFSSRCFARSN